MERRRRAILLIHGHEFIFAKNLDRRLAEPERNYDAQFEAVCGAIRARIEPPLSRVPAERRIGLAHEVAR